MTNAMLAIECSQRSASVAVAIDGQPPQAQSVRSDRRSDDDLLPAIDRLLSSLELQPENLTAVAVSIGPGGFTGLRISIAAAKMLGVSLGAELVAVPSAMVAAYAIEGPGPSMIVLACKGQSFWATTVEIEDGHWTCQQPGELLSVETVNLDGIRCLVGDTHLPQSLRAKAEAQHVEVVEPIFDAKNCLLVGQHMLAKRQIVAPDQLQPLYPRDAEAVRLFRQRQLGRKS